MNDSKNTLRAKYREIRKSIKNKCELENSICNLFLQSDIYRNCNTLFLYSAVGSEADIERITATALAEGKKVALPVCLDKDGNMSFYFIRGLCDINKGMYAIREPKTELCPEADFDSETVCLVPGLCFDKQGGRLGYGKGYYDRFLQKFTGTSVGICFESCLTDSLILDTHDKTVNYLITDKKIYIFR